MELALHLPNNKEVIAREFVYKDLKQLIYLKDSSLACSTKFLESFICTKNLNVLEKFSALILLRKRCVGDNITMNSDKGGIQINLDFILKNIGGAQEIKKHVDINDVKYVLNYPSRFNLGDSDSIFSLIESIQIGDEIITTGELTSEEFNQLVNSLPKQLLPHLSDYLDKTQRFFNINVWAKREKVSIDELSLNVLSTDLPAFLISIFNVMVESDYREFLFALSHRIPDMAFLTNCTFKEIEDFYSLYEREINNRDANLQSSSAN